MDNESVPSPLQIVARLRGPGSQDTLSDTVRNCSPLAGLPPHCTAWVPLAFFTFYQVSKEMNKIQIREKTKCQKTRVNPTPLLNPPLA